jgi:hypothetical protein
MKNAVARLLLGGLVSVAMGALGACSLDTVPAGYGPTPPGDGPLVVFDLTRRPLPEIPLPNDVATTADPTSRTGRRINVSLLAPSRLERAAREGFVDMEGWGTFQQISVAFERPKDVPEGIAAIDVDRLAAHMQRDGHDFADDPVYLVNLATGIPVPLDMAGGDFPLSVQDPNKYFPNDPRVTENNLLFETFDEAQGLLPSQYTPALDTDFDGVLDRPNTFGVVPPGGIKGVDDLLTFYERESDTLILRPLLPLDETTTYAVVLTDRLKDPNGRPVRSPFSYVHHATQAAEAARISDIVSNKDLAAYYGNISGTGLAHVAFTWSFTTQPVFDDMRIVRDGLYGRGPLAHLAGEYPTDATAFRATGTVPVGTPDPANWQSNKECTGHTDNLYVVRYDEAKDTVHQFLLKVLNLDENAAELLEKSLENVDYFVVGSFQSPYFMGDPKHEDPDGRFRINWLTGEGPIQPDTVPFWISVPKKTKTHAQPFPATVWAHGSGNNGAEIIVRSGYFAKQGVAMIGIDLPGHGLVLDRGQTDLARAFLANACLVPWLDGITQGRAYDLNGDGLADSGGLLWSAHIFHSRDNIRQSVVDMMQATRILKTFDGKTMSAQDFNGDGKLDLAGDFDADGVPDLGGSSDIYASGNSLGGVLALVDGAVDPTIQATASISGGGGLMDVAMRSTFVPESVLEQVMSPLVVALPAKERANMTGNGTQCTGDARTVRFVLNDLTNSREVEIACLTPDELAAGMTIVLTNSTNKEVRCGRAGTDGRFRVPIPASVGDALHVEVFTQRDAVESYATCKLIDGATLGRHIDTFEHSATSTTSIPDGAPTCDDAVQAGGFDDGTSCAQFQGVFYPVGSKLVAPQEGLGLRRQTPDFRRLIALTQAAIDPADPVNFAPYFYKKAFRGIDGTPAPARAVMQFDTDGDPLVPDSTGYAFARSLGALPFFPPSAATQFPAYADYATPAALYQSFGGRTADDLVRQYWAIEGASRLSRTSAGMSCENNLVPVSMTCPDGPKKDTSFCSQALADVDWLAEGADLYDTLHPPVPARLARSATIVATDDASLERAWNARLTAVPFSADGVLAPSTKPMVGVVDAYINPLGQHVWALGDPCKAFDDAIYYDHLLIRFLATRGADVYFLSHPASHRCLENESCGFF